MLRLASSLLFKLANGLAVNILRFIVLVIAARMMTKDDFGTYSYVVNFAFLAVALANLGLPTATARNMSAALFHEKDEARAKAILKLAAQWRLIATTAALGIFIGVIVFLQLHQRKGSMTIWILASGILFFKSFDVWLEYTFAGLQEYRLLFLGVTLPREAIRLAMIGVLVWLGMSTRRLLAVDGSILAFSLLIATIILVKQFKHVATLRIDWRPLITFALSIAPTSIIALAYERVDVIILGKYVPMSQVAEYNAAYQFTALAILLVPIGTVVVLPTFMSMDRGHLNRFVNQIIGVSLALLLPVFFALQIFGEELLTVLYGHRYASSAIILGIFAFLLLERVISPTLQNVLLAFNQPKTITVTMTIGGVINIILAIWLVQKLGVIGPAIALVSGRFLVLTLLVLVLATNNFGFYYKKFTLIIISAGILFTGAWLIKPIVERAIFYIVALIIYSILITRFVMAEETRILIALIQKHRYNWRSLLTPS